MKAHALYFAVVASLFVGSLVERLGMSDGSDW